KQIMTPNPACCTSDSTARETAILMRDNDCGSIPVVENTNTKRLIGTVTDRDLAIRGLAAGLGPGTPIRDLMTYEPVTSVPEDEIENLRQVMIEQQVRRVPVVDVDGMLVGIVAQADVAREEGAASDREVGRIIEAISEPRSDLPA
ncbi:MAG TPA: CBS domain-containing protein, partial [Gemmatimonadales bacterium]|nr:CBS domain-containing protein [Gemmatimonadales bacterium]